MVKFLQIWSHCLSLTLVRSGQSWSRMWVWWRTCHSPIWPRGRSGAAGRWLARWTPSPSTDSLTLMTCVPASACQAEEQPWRGGILVRWLTLIKNKIRKVKKFHLYSLFASTLVLKCSQIFLCLIKYGPFFAFSNKIVEFYNKMPGFKLKTLYSWVSSYNLLNQ